MAEHIKVSLLGFQEQIPGRDRVAFWEGEGGAEEMMESPAWRVNDENL